LGIVARRRPYAVDVRRFGLALGLVCAVGAGACAEERVAEVEHWAVPAVTLPEPGGPATHPVVAIGTRRHGSSIALVSYAGKRRLLVADADARALLVLDADNDEQLSVLALPGRPGQLLPTADGRVYLSLRNQDRVVGAELSDPQGDAFVLTRELAVPLDPVGLASTPDGTKLLVVSAWEAQLVTFDLASQALLGTVRLAREPRSVAVPPSGETAFVTHASAGQITRVALASAAPTAIALAGHDVNPGFGMSAALSELDMQVIGSLGTADAGHADLLAPSEITSAPGPAQVQRGSVDFRGGDEFGVLSSGDESVGRDAAQGFAIAMGAETLFVPEVLVHRGRATTGGYGTSESFPAHQPALVQIDLMHLDVEPTDATIRVMNRAFSASRSRSGFGGGARRDDCKLPRAAAVDTVGGSVLVACWGTDELLAFDTAAGPLSLTARGRWKLPSGPSGIVIDGREAVIWSAFDRAVSRVRLPEAEEPEGSAQPTTTTSAKMRSSKKGRMRYPNKPSSPMRSTAMPPLPKTDARASKARGRAIFAGAGDARISADGRSCASCHPDGRDDGLTWPTPHGPRQTPMLAGRLRANTQPYGWHGDTDSVPAHITQTFARLGGRGLDEAAMVDLMAYLNGMEELVRPAPKQDDAAVVRGRALFESETVGCSLCHTAQGVGSDGARHDVGTGVAVETPSLRFVAGTGPYLHDGRYATLSQLLRETKGKMGWAAEMPPADLAALEAYLLTL
jgi:mono/diheme cytochrome c family protein/DNA-binding beta-propeller fold protein YncE